MVRVTKGIVVAFVAVLICNSHYNHDGVGMVAAAAVSGGGEAEADGSTRGVPVPTRKLNKSSKASKPNDSEYMERLLRLLVFTTAMDVYRSMQPPPSSEAAAVARAGNDGGGRELELETAEERYDKHACDNCLAFYKSVRQRTFLQDIFCDIVATRSLPSTDAFVHHVERPSCEYERFDTCFDILQCASGPNRTPTTCCSSQGLCKNSGYYCKLSCNSGSCENYWIQTKTQAECDTESTAIGCGSCKDQGDSAAILEQAGMPTNGFVSLCVGGPCVWTTQKTQCMGLTHYPAITTQSACEDACCGDNTCAVWQFNANGYSNQCWYGANCDEKGGLTWTYGGIRKMGTNQAPDCVQPYF